MTKETYYKKFISFGEKKSVDRELSPSNGRFYRRVNNYQLFYNKRQISLQVLIIDDKVKNYG